MTLSVPLTMTRVMVVDRRSGKIPFPWDTDKFENLSSLIDKLREELKVTRRDNVTLYVIGLTDEQIYNLTLSEFSELHGAILIESSVGDVKLARFPISERVDLLHKHMKREGCKTKSEASQDCETAVEELTGLSPSEISESRTILQDVRAETAHPTWEVLMEYAPDLEPDIFDAAIPQNIRTPISMLYYTAIPPNSQILLDAVNEEQDRQERAANRRTKRDKETVRLHVCSLLMCRWEHSRTLWVSLVFGLVRPRRA